MRNDRVGINEVNCLFLFNLCNSHEWIGLTKVFIILLDR